MIKPVRLVILSMILLFTGALLGQGGKSVSKADLVVSVWYSGGKARAPMLSEITPNSRDEWRRDLQQIKSLGFNTVRTWVDWQRCEARKGEYNFENLKLLLELAQEVGLKVIIQVYSGWDGFGFAPDWVHKKFPDGFIEEQKVYEISSPPSNSYCSDHKGIRDAVLNFYTETAKIAVQYPNFYGWDLWSEPRSARFVCQGTQERFRQWLKKKYRTLDALNQAWYETYERWEDIQPQRSGGIGTYTMSVDWSTFINEKGAEDLRMRYEAVRKADKTHLITSHAPSPSLFGRLDDFLMAESVDFYGLSVYPIWRQETNLWSRVIIGPDFSRSANKKNGGFYAGEFQAGFATVGTSVGDPVTPDDHRTWIWSLIAKGAKGVNVYAYYVMSSGRESGGFGLIGLDGVATERAKELGKNARIIYENNELFAKSIPTEADIALVYNPLSQMVGRSRGSDGGHHRNSLIGYYRTFAENNIPVDFIHRRDLEKGDVSGYKLIIFPYPIMITRKAVDGLRNYIEQGGCVVAEARLAWNDERGYTSEVIPGMGLSEVFGVQETKVITRDEVMMKVIDNSHPAMAKLEKNDILKGAHFAESVEPLKGKETQVLASFDDGTPCIVASQYGKGKTLLVGSFLGIANNTSSDENNNKFILSLLDWAKVVRPFKTSHDGKNPDTPVEVRLQENSEGYLLFIINHGETKESINVDLNIKKEGEYTLHEVIQDKTLRKESRNKMLNINTSDIPGKHVEVWSIK